jgi:hypothetical protein
MSTRDPDPARAERPWATAPWRRIIAGTGAGTDNSVYRRTVTDSGGGSGWSSLGGVATSRPGIAVAPTGVESVVVRAATAQAAIRQRTGPTWGAWQSLGGTLAPFAPAAAVTANGLLTVAVVGTDKAVYANTRSTAGGWSGWRRIGGTTDADVGLTATADGTRLLAVVRATNHNAYVSVGSADGSTWSTWAILGGLLASAPAATVDGAALEVVAAGTDGRYYRNTATDGTAVTGWTGWRALP